MTPTGRDNGLPAAARYVALVDVDPPVADHVLSLLRDAGVAAVAEPLAGEVNVGSRATTPPDRPTDRIHVDREHHDLAAAVVGEALPTLRGDFHADAARRQDAEDAASERRRRELDADEVESLFDQIVAGFDDEGTDPVPRWSVLEDAAPDAEPEAGSRPPLSSRLVRRADAGAPPVPDDDPADHFVPPPPPPLPETDRITRFAWAALIGGPVIFILAAIFQIYLDGWLSLIALGMFVGGFGTLVARMRDRPRQDDGWDDGAVL